MKKEIILLILGALTSIVLIRFDLQNGFEYLGNKIIFSLIDYAGESSTDKFLTTQIIGYLIFLVFILLIRKHFIDKNQIAITVFIILVIIGIFNESLALYENFNGEFKGRHFRIGNTLTLLGILFLIKIKRLNFVQHS